MRNKRKVQNDAAEKIVNGMKIKRMDIDGVSFEYPELSMDGTLARLFGFVKCMSGLPKSEIDGEHGSWYMAILWIAANAIVHLENSVECDKRLN